MFSVEVSDDDVEKFNNYKVIASNNMTNISLENCTEAGHICVFSKNVTVFNITVPRPGQQYELNIFTEIGGQTSDPPLTLSTYTGM